jgi:hypothetical protein
MARFIRTTHAKRPRQEKQLRGIGFPKRPVDCFRCPDLLPAVFQMVTGLISAGSTAPSAIPDGTSALAKVAPDKHLRQAHRTDDPSDEILFRPSRQMEPIEVSRVPKNSAISRFFARI